MKRPTVALAIAAVAVLAFAIQVSLPPVLSTHVAKLKEAQGLKAKVVVNQVGGAQTTFDFVYAKPGSLKIDGPNRLVVTDGKDISILDKAKNSYTQVPVDKDAIASETGIAEVLGWAGFFEQDPAKLYKLAKAGGTRKLRGTEVTEAEVTLADGKSTATLYIDPKLGIVRGYQLTAQDSKQYIVWAETIEITAAPAASTFAFTPPAGATKVEPGAVADIAWAEVSKIFTQKCMPCHSSQVMSGRLDLSTYATASGNRFVIKGDSKNSILVLSLSAAGGKRMPQGRPPLPDSEKQAIAAWIDGGLKQ